MSKIGLALTAIILLLCFLGAMYLGTAGYYYLSQLFG